MRHLASLSIAVGVLASSTGSLQAGVINEDLKLLAADGAPADSFGWFIATDGVFDDNFGWSVAIDDGIVVVGAPFDGDNGFRSGSALIYLVRRLLAVHAVTPAR